MIIEDSYLDILAEGYYQATFEGFMPGPNAQTKMGLCQTIEGTFRLHNLFTLDQFKKQRFLAYKSNEKLIQLFKAILGECPEQMDTDVLVGKDCIIEIKHNKSLSTGRVFANVVNVLALGSVDPEDILNREEILSEEEDKLRKKKFLKREAAMRNANLQAEANELFNDDLEL